MEIELKYSAAPETGRKIIADLEESSGAEAREIPMEAVYFDTEEIQLPFVQDVPRPDREHFPVHQYCLPAFSIHSKYPIPIYI